MCNNSVTELSQVYQNRYSQQCHRAVTTLLQDSHIRDVKQTRLKNVSAQPHFAKLKVESLSGKLSNYSHIFEKWELSTHQIFRRKFGEFHNLANFRPYFFEENLANLTTLLNSDSIFRRKFGEFNNHAKFRSDRIFRRKFYECNNLSKFRPLIPASPQKTVCRNISWRNSRWEYDADRLVTEINPLRQI